ncbi:MAG: hypothetical protein AB2687_08080 [Candidatus Thiodiazotropha taylori]
MEFQKKVSDKLEEVQFFIELYNALEMSGVSFTRNTIKEKEASYILSAILNGFYSATELLKNNKKNIEQVIKFKNQYPVIYSRSEKGGLRNTTVHVKHVGIDYSGYISQSGNNLNFNFKRSPKLITNPTNISEKVILNHNKYFYLKIDDEHIRVSDLVGDHYYTLERFAQILISAS